MTVERGARFLNSTTRQEIIVIRESVIVPRDSFFALRRAAVRPLSSRRHTVRQNDAEIRDDDDCDDGNYNSL